MHIIIFCCVNLYIGDYDLVILDDEHATGGRVKHVRIRKQDDSGKYFITRGRTFETVPALISYYKRKSSPSCLRSTQNADTRCALKQQIIRRKK